MQQWQDKIQEYVRRHKQRRRWKRLTAALAVFAVAATTAATILPGITQERDPDLLECQLNLHTHVESCYDQSGNLTCGYADYVVHTHNDSCYGEGGKLICPLEEIQAHTHDDSCYETTLTLICEQEETPGHTHTADCLDEEGNLICGQTESEGHTHTADCYQTSRQLICQKEEIVLHTHTADCFDESGKPICGMTEVKEHVHDQSCVPEKEQPEVQSQDSVNWSIVVKEGYSPTRARQAAVMQLNSLRAEQGGVDFGPYITEITLSQEENGQWVPVSEVTSGDSIRLDIQYAIPENIVGPNSRVIYYQLPDGIGLESEISGQTTINGAYAGDYVIQPDGLIQITFTQSFADNQPFTGELHFQGLVTASGSGEGGSIDLGLAGGAITVKPNEKATDLSIQKSSWYDKSTNRIFYTITVSSQNGTDGPIIIEDRFVHSPDYGTINYNDIQSFCKRDAQGGETYPTTQEEIQALLNLFQVQPQTDSQAASFRLGELEALGPGESYVLVYTAIPDFENSVGDANGYLQFTNNATASDQKHSVEASTNTIVSNPMVEKQGEYDPLTRTIKWTILINENQWEIGGMTLTDTLTYTVNGQEYTMQLPSTVRVELYYNYQPLGVVYDNIPLPFTFPENSNAQYLITYETELPEDLPQGSSVVFNNRAQLGKFWTEINVGVNTPGDYGIIKGLIDSDVETGLVDWAVSLAHPHSPDLANLQYVDFIPNLMLEDGSVLPNSQYITPSLLLESLSVQTLDGVTLEYGTDYTIQAVARTEIDAFMEQNNVTNEADFAWAVASGSYQELAYYLPWQDIQSFEQNERLGMFAILFTQNASGKLADSNLLITYRTQIDLAELPENAEKVGIFNLGRIPSAYAQAQGELSVLEKLNKQVSLTGVPAGGNDTSSYTDESLTAGSGDIGNILHYRILISNYSEFNDENAITVTDILPPGAELIRDSVILRDHSSSSDFFAAESNSSWYLTQITTQENPDGTTTVTFLIAHIQDFNNQPFGLYYDVSIANDTELVENGEKVYTNTASWDGYSDSTSTTVEHSLPRVEKTGEQLQAADGSGEMLDVLRYYIIVNPEEKKLNPYNDTLTLEDTLTVPAGSSASLQPDSVALYRYDTTAQDNHYCGEAIDPSLYSAEYDAEANTITFTLPDQTACVLVYDYQIDRGTAAGDLDVYNTVKLSGQQEFSSESGIIMKEEESSASVNKAVVTIYKHESGNTLKLLPGATFRLERYEQTESGYEWRPTSATALGQDGLFVVGEEGKITLSFLGETTLYNTLYRLEEVDPPDGYLKSGQPYYFIWLRRGETQEDAIQRMQESGALGDVSPDQIVCVGYSTSHSIYVPNEPDQVTVTKEWRNDTGEMLEQPPMDQITVQLYQWKGDSKTPYGDAVTLSEENNWSHTWQSLPKTDEGGTPFYYTVEEEALSGFEVQYTNNNGVQTGTITITNTRNQYVLPQTGGIGPIPMAAAGVLLALASGFGYFYLRRRRRKEGDR